MNKKFSFQESLINLFLTTFSLYSSLLFIDFLIRVAGINNPHKEPDKIEAKRMIEEDIPLRKKAIKNGMKPIIFPFKVREESRLFNISYASLAFEITLFNVDSNSSLLTSEKSSKVPAK